MRAPSIALAAAALALLGLPAACSRPEAPEAAAAAPAAAAEEETDPEVVLPDYSEVRTKPFPVAVQCWTYRRFTFLETLDKVRALGISLLQAYPGQRLGPEFADATFDHRLPAETIKALRAKLAAAGLQVVAYGVVDIGTTETSMRQVFDFARAMGVRTVVCEPADDDFTLLEKLVQEYNLRIAIHNHPLPSKYARPETVLANVRGRDERIGACADTGHWMRVGLNPVECLRLLQGRIVDLHLKDRSAFGTGEDAFDVAWGAGKGRLRDVLAEATLQDYAGALTIEYENEANVLTPEPDIRAGLEFLKSATYYDGYTQLLSRSGGRYEKHGWNHYGPGFFEIDERTGVLKSQGGMGLLWYARKTFKDFVLELDYRCSTPTTNSGIFFRVPGVPASDEYIYHAFEIQIDDHSQGVHHTGSAYDAEAAKAGAARPTGEWNHMKIACRGRNVQVEINGQAVLDWDMEPRGKIKDYALEGYIGLQNHDSISPVYFRDIFLKEL